MKLGSISVPPVRIRASVANQSRDREEAVAGVSARIASPIPKTSGSIGVPQVRFDAGGKTN